MREPILKKNYPNYIVYIEALANAPVLWALTEPIDSPEIVAHAANILLADLEIVTVNVSYNGKNSYECAVLSQSARRAAEDWYLRQGLWPFSTHRITWEQRSTLILEGYPLLAQKHPAGQVNIDRALAAFREESRMKELRAGTQSMSAE